MSRYLVVTGLPASGKSTLARAVGNALALPVVDKDEILEALFDSLGVDDAEWRRRLSRAADEVLRRQASQFPGAVLTSWWQHPRSPVESGTASEWLSSLPGPLIEIHCLCSPRIAAERFLARRRHSGHLDGKKSYPELLASFEDQAALGPLGIGRLVQVSTDGEVDLNAVVAEVVATSEFDAVEMVRKIRDDLYEQTKDMSAAELVEFFRLHGASAKEKISRVEPHHELAARTGE
jgi:hypothetical protein